MLGLLLGIAWALSPLTITPVKPLLSSQGSGSSYLFSFRMNTSLASASLAVRFPSEFSAVQLASAGPCRLRQGGQWATLPCSYNSTAVVLAVPQGLAATATELWVEGVTNPSSYKSTAPFQVCAIQGTVSAECDLLEGVILSPAMATSANAVAVQALGNAITGATSSYEFNFTLGATYPAGNTVRVTFPNGFSITNATCEFVSGSSRQRAATLTHPDFRSVDCLALNKTLST
jgi:hypothetical protein